MPPAPTFMDAYPIDTTTQNCHSILLIPIQFLYPTNNHHIKEVESHKFQKAKLQVKFTGPGNVFTFYEAFRHIARSFNILLRSLTDITRETGTCELTPTNCLGYTNVYQVMSTAIYLKLTSSDYFKSFPQAQTYVRAASHTSNGDYQADYVSV